VTCDHERRVEKVIGFPKKNILPALITDKLYVLCIVSVLDFSTSMMLVYFRLSLFHETPQKKTLAQLWMSICEQKKSLFWLGLKGFCPPKAFVELPTLAAQPQRLRSQGI